MTGRRSAEHAGIIVYDHQAEKSPAQTQQLAQQIGAIADNGPIINELWVSRGGRWFWYRWTADGFDKIAVS